jgi:hypothetical protein
LLRSIVNATALHCVQREADRLAASSSLEHLLALPHNDQCADSADRGAVGLQGLRNPFLELARPC